MMKFDNIHGKDRVYTVTTVKGVRYVEFPISGYGSKEKDRENDMRFKQLADYFKLQYTSRVEVF